MAKSKSAPQKDTLTNAAVAIGSTLGSLAKRVGLVAPAKKAAAKKKAPVKKAAAKKVVAKKAVAKKAVAKKKTASKGVRATGHETHG